MNEFTSEEETKADRVLELMGRLHDKFCAQFSDPQLRLDAEYTFGRTMTACVEQMTLVALLVDKGIITNDEYLDALIMAYSRAL